MKTKILLLLLVATCVNAMAFDCFKEGTVWVQEEFGTSSPELITGLNTFVIEGDTLINGKTYMKLYNISDEEPSRKILMNCLRKDGDKIFFLPYKGATEEVLMYDFGMKEGDTAEIGFLPPILNEESYAVRTQIKCVGISAMTIGDNEFEIMELEEYNDDFSMCWGKGKWIKGVASMNGLTRNGNFELDGGGSNLIRVVVDEQTIIELPTLSIDSITAEPKAADGLRYKLDGTLFQDGDKGFYIQNGKIYIKR